jgi:poly(3-hydroxybutyrate) depolymerase
MLLLALLPVLAGCPVMQSQNTPVDQLRLEDPASGDQYWVYVPSYYTPDRDWPVVITLHGTHGFDSASAQIREWKALAEEAGLIVAAPDLHSPQGILPVLESMRNRDLAVDEQTILGCLDFLRARYAIDEKAVLLTGFSAGGYAMYYTGLRHPDRFSALAARACNSDLEIFENLSPDDQARKLPIIIIHGQDDLGAIGTQSWEAFRWLREHGFKGSEHHKIKGGHIRQPQVALQYWLQRLPAKDRPSAPAAASGI